MKIVKQDKKEGIVTLVPETLDDLWHLSHIVEVGDSVSSKTTRRIQDNTGDKLRSDRGVKKTFTLRIDVENITFHIFTGKLRLTGVITKGPEDLIPLGSHHTVEVKLNTPITKMCIRDRTITTQSITFSLINVDKISEIPKERKSFILSCLLDVHIPKSSILNCILSQIAFLVIFSIPLW